MDASPNAYCIKLSELINAFPPLPTHPALPLNSAFQHKMKSALQLWSSCLFALKHWGIQ